MVFYKRQFDFQKNYSTCHAIITLVERVSKAIDTGKYVVGAFLDLKKAFDHGLLDTWPCMCTINPLIMGQHVGRSINTIKILSQRL